jgi:hypothetical protein
VRRDGGFRLMSEPRPLVVNYNGFKTITGNLSTLVAEPAAQSALEAFESALETVARPMLIRPGSTLLFSNIAALHSRAAISTPRWLQRCYMRRSLDLLREACDSPGGKIFSMAEIIGQYSIMPRRWRIQPGYSPVLNHQAGPICRCRSWILWAGC